VFLSHSQHDAAVANYLEDLLRIRFGKNIKVFNSSRNPLTEVPPEENGKTGYQLVAAGYIPETPPSASYPYHIPGVDVKEPTHSSKVIRDALDDAISKSTLVVVILTQHSANSSWVSIEAQEDIFEPPRRYSQ
jgi:hypothetical protein